MEQIVNKPFGVPGRPSRLAAEHLPLWGESGMAVPVACLPSNNDTGGWPELPTTSRVKIWNGASSNLTYAHHPIIEVFGGTVAAIWSSAEVDEDSNGQSIVGAISTDQGRTWSDPEVMLPGALLPNQTEERTLIYW